MAVSTSTKIGLDVSDVVAAASQYAQALGLQVNSLDGLIVKNIEFNRQGKIIRAEVQAQIDAYRTLALEIGKASKAQVASGAAIRTAATAGNLGVRSGGIQTSTGPTPNSAAVDVAAGITAQQRARDIFPAPTGVTLTQLASYEKSISSIGKLLSSGKVTSSRFEEILTGVRTGKPLASLNLNEQEIKLVGALTNIGKNFNDASSAAEKFHLTTRNAFRIAEALLLKDAIGLLVRQLQTAVIEAAHFQIQISQIRTLSQAGGDSFNAWSKSIQSVSDALGVPQTEVATAAYEALSNQITKGSDQTEKFVKSAGDLGRVGVAKTTDAVEVLSSAINAYRIDVTRADELNAKFFKAVDLGRFVIKDLAGNFGRVSAPAAALGVSIDEVLGAIAALTNQGVKADDAQTQLLNIFLKLTKPTEGMTRLLNSYGVATGQAAIETFGFLGLLNKIEESTKGDASALAELGGELRAIRGLTGLTTRDFGETFRSFTKQISGEVGDPNKDFAKAKQIRAESAGDQLTIELNKVKNFFVNDLGQSFINTIAQVNKDFLSISGTVETFTKGIIGLIKVYAVYKGGLTAVSVVQGVYNSALVLNTINAYKNATATTVMGRSFTAAGAAMRAVPWLQIAGLAAAAFIIYNEAVSESTKKTEEFEKVTDKLKKQREGRNETGGLVVDDKFAKSTKNDSSAFAKQVDAIVGPELVKQSELFKQSQARLTELKASGVDAANTLRVAFDLAQDRIRESIKSYAENIRKAKESIQQSKKDILGLAETVNGLIFDLKKDFASPIQQFQLRDQEIQRLSEQVRQLFAVGTDEAIQEARQKGKELLSLVKEDAKERVQSQVDAEKEARRAAFEASGGRFGDNTPIRAFTSEQENRLRSFGEFLTNLEKNSIINKQKQIQENQKLIDTEETRLRLLKLAEKSFLALEPTDKGGGIVKDFKDPNGKLDENKFSAEFDKRSKAVVDLLQTEQERSAALLAFELKKKNLIAQQNELLNLQAIERKQLELGNKKDELKSGFEKAGTDRIKLREQLDKIGKDIGGTTDIIGSFLNRAQGDNSIKTIGADADPIRKIGLQIGEAVNQGLKVFPGGQQLGTTERAKIANENQPLIQQIVELNKTIISDRDALVRRDEKGNLTGTTKDAEKLQADTAKAALLLNELVGKFTGQRENGNFAVPGGASLNEVQGNLKTQAQQAVGVFQAEKIAQQQQEQFRNSLENFANNNRNAINNNINALNPNTTAISNNTLTTETLIKQLQATQIVAPPAANIPVDPGGFHHGGLIKGPGGFDNLLIRAEAGEFVMSQRATRQWLPQLIQMNRGGKPKIPGHYHEGGIIQTNVGDVNVTLAGPISPQKNIREVGKALRREIRRGNLDLSKRT